MSQTEKAAYYAALKAAGVAFNQHYREYSTADLKTAYNELRTRQAAAGQQVLPESPVAAEEPAEAPAAPDFPPLPDLPPVSSADPDEVPGQRLNTHDDGMKPLRTDERGRVWYQEEVLKPAVPQPRGRRVLTYQDTGVETKTVQIGEYTESFEVAGQGAARPAQIKITMPSYQVGIYKDPRFPFKVHTYGGNEGFDLFEVQNYYGGPELVPAEVKRVYISNSLCYDIRTTIRAIEAEYRRLQLAGKVD
jgi:hypothetical protein